MLKFLEDFHSQGKSPNGGNASFIKLIPKRERTRFREI